ncbi:hypothetical protein MTR72_16460 [Bradyrhizobium sp. ISRA442]|uniref:hypothetical protein n=1 Tax=Bradyrhizobium sp. ISRA442 TaxID=2866197 RepID=UPI00311AF756
MNAAVKVSNRRILGDVDDFVEVCGQQAWFFSEGWIDLHTAVDNLQRLAELWGLIEEVGQDAIQALMADAFAPMPELPSGYAAQLLMRFELDDERDRWKWTGELPPKPEPQTELPPRKPYQTPQSTIDAFLHVARSESTEYLTDWLTRHPLDAPHLHKLWKAKCSTAPAT